MLQGILKPARTEQTGTIIQLEELAILIQEEEVIGRKTILVEPIIMVKDIQLKKVAVEGSIIIIREAVRHMFLNDINVKWGSIPFDMD